MHYFGGVSIIMLATLALGSYAEDAAGAAGAAGAGCSLLTCAPEQTPADYHEYEHDMTTFVQNNKLVNIQKVIDDASSTLPVLSSPDNENCATITTTKRPYTLQVQNATFVIVQTPAYRQEIYWTECVSQHSPCMSTVFVGNEGTSCEPEYTVISLYVYNPLDKSYAYQDFRVPVACVCKLS